MAAAGSGHVEAAQYAYEFDKDVNAVDDQGSTAMHASVSGGSGASQTDMTESGAVPGRYRRSSRSSRTSADGRRFKVGDNIPFDKPIQRMADIIVSRGGTPQTLPEGIRQTNCGSAEYGWPSIT